MLRVLCVTAMTGGLLAGQATVADEIDRILDWLPEDTESIVVASSPWLITAESESLLEASRSYTLAPLWSAAGDTIPSEWLGTTLRFGVLAGKEFRTYVPGPPNRVGLIANASCAFLGFVDVPMDLVASLDGQVILLEGQEVTVVVGAEDGVEYSIALAEPLLVIVCNDREFMTTVLRRRVFPIAARALPESLPEWKYVDREAPVWGLRHFLPARDTDPTNPRSPGAEYPEAGAFGIVIALPVDSPVVRAVWLSTSETNIWEEIVQRPTMKGLAEASGSAIEGYRIESPNVDDAGVVALLSVMALLGFAIPVW